MDEIKNFFKSCIIIIYDNVERSVRQQCHVEVCVCWERFMGPWGALIFKLDENIAWRIKSKAEWW